MLSQLSLLLFAAIALTVSATSLRGDSAADKVSHVAFLKAMEEELQTLPREHGPSFRLLQGGGPCTGEFDAFKACLAGLKSSGVQCGACIMTAEQNMWVGLDGLGCDEYENRMCTALQGCHCKSCSDEIEQAMNCIADHHSEGVCEVNCGSKMGFVKSGPVGADVIPRVRVDICNAPKQYVYGSYTGADVLDCRCSEDKIKRTVDIICGTTDGRSKYFKFTNNAFDLYLETPAVHPSIAVVVLNDVAYGPCGVLPTNVTKEATANLCRSCETCKTGTMIGVKYSCHGLSSNVCNPIFSSSLVDW